LYNKLNQPLPHAAEIVTIESLMCNIYSPSSKFVIILPKNKNEYYFFYDGFTSSTLNNPCFRYAIVDMRLDGGLGDVVPDSADIMVDNTLMINFTAVKNNDSAYHYWLIGRYADSIYAFPVSPAGVGNPIKSYAKECIPFPRRVAANAYFNGDYKVFDNGNSNTLAHSNDGSFILSVSFGGFDTLEAGNTPGIGSSCIYGYDFNTVTGQLTNPRIIESQVILTNIMLTYYHVYVGAAFSPNDSLFYVTDENEINDSNILQFQRYAPDISASLIPVGFKGGSKVWGLKDAQLAPDGKIYIGDSGLDVVDKPDNIGKACNFHRSPYFNRHRKDMFGNNEDGDFFFPNLFFDYRPLRFFSTVGCNGNVHLSNTSDTSFFKKFWWYFSDISGRIIDSLPGKNSGYQFLTAGRYIVRLRGFTTAGYGQWFSDSITVPNTITFTSTTAVNILSASVLAPSKIKINWLPLTGAANYTVYLHKGGITAQLATTPDTAFYDTLTPLSVFTNDSSYYYIRATDSCGNTSLPSAIARPILLTAANHDNQYALINWTPYEYWPTVPPSGGFRGVALSYQIQVLQNGSFTGYFDTPDTNYTDNAFFDSTLSSSQRCYRIEAIQNGGNHATSYSNIVCVPYLPTFWVPTAFTPNGDGLNDVFKVTAIGISSSAFSLKIFNAWGEFIFQSTDPNQGWDGTFHGKPSPEGPYLYIITATMNENKTINTSGTLNLMR